MGALVVGYAFVLSFFMDRMPSYDEVLLFNPVYMFVNHGRLVYPAYDHPDMMIIHPPMHSLQLGLLMKAGLNLFHAAGVPIFVLTLVTVVLTLRARFPTEVKLALLAGFFVATFIWAPLYLVRPDVHRAMAWFAGLVALESARLDDWCPRKLFLGAFLLALASSLHYASVPAAGGALVYLVWAAQARGLAQARRQIAAIVGGGALIAVPYAALWLIPYWNSILGGIREVQGGAGGPPLHAFDRHLQFYDQFRGQLLAVNLRPVTSRLTAPLFEHRVPAVFVGTPLLLLHPTTRGLALGALPALLFFLVFTRHKFYEGYFIGEMTIYFCGVFAAATLGITWVVRRLRSATLVSLAMLALGLLGATLILWDSPYTLSHRLALRGTAVEMDFARAAAQEMLGPDALVGTRGRAIWYASGARRLYIQGGEVQRLRTAPRAEADAYFRRFDAIAQHFHRGDHEWYVDGVLELRGFYFGDRHSAQQSIYSYLLQTSQPVSPVLGFAYTQGEAFRFEEDAAGDHVFASLVCPNDIVLTGASPFFTNMALPRGFVFDRFTDPTVPLAVKAFVLPRSEYERVKAVEAERCIGLDEVPLTRAPVDINGMLATLKREDRPMEFLRTLDDVPR